MLRSAPTRGRETRSGANRTISLFPADFDFVAGLQLEFKVAPACYFVGAKAIVPALGALHRGRCIHRPKDLAFPAKVRASGPANKGDAPHGERAHLSGLTSLTAPCNRLSFSV